MKRFAKFVVICALITVSGYATISIVYPTFYVRYQLSFDVEVDGNMKTSSGVVEIEYPTGPDIFAHTGGGRAFRGFFHGNAITIDLGERGLIFVVNMRSLASVSMPDGRARLRRIASTSLTDLPLEAHGFPSDGLPSRMADFVRQLLQRTDSIEVPVEKLPMFVRFRDVNDQNSIEEIDPSDITDAYGQGVRLVRARLELTKDPISPIPSIWPKWLADAKTAGFTVNMGAEERHPLVNLTLDGFKGE
ncbi:hypothetical protein [Methylocapsa sp. S129]|uniref:hypothetical protein n=1 Tax=Methylocapsa sp. S129 TaxID=1641869 RepID=UPI00131CB2A5|nr:hypothetical protein [Methylocapsa sp. S129]